MDLDAGDPKAAGTVVDLALLVWCKEDGGMNEGDRVRYGIAVTIEAEGAQPIYEEIQQRLRVRPRP